MSLPSLQRIAVLGVLVATLARFSAVMANLVAKLAEKCGSGHSGCNLGKTKKGPEKIRDLFQRMCGYD